MIKVWLLQIGESLPNIPGIKCLRSAILAKNLIARGHDVTWWASAFDHFKKVWISRKEEWLDLPGGGRVFTIKGCGYRKNISIQRFLDHKIIAGKFRRLAEREIRPDVMVISLPPHDLAAEAVTFARENNIPVILDVRDPWPDVFLYGMKPTLKAAMRFMLRREFRILKRALDGADSIVTVNESLLDWALKYAGRPKRPSDRIFYLGGDEPALPDPSMVGKEFLSLMDRLKGKFVASFIGTFGRYHDPSVIVETARLIRNNDIHFVIAGGGDLYGKIKAKAKGLFNVHLPGWLNNDEISLLVNNSSAGLCPSSGEIKLFPNKAFTYLSAGLPLVSSFEGELRNIIETEGIGLNFKPGDVSSLVSALLRLYNEPSLIDGCRSRAKKLFMDRFRAETIYDNFTHHIEDVAREYKTARIS